MLITHVTKITMNKSFFYIGALVLLCVGGFILYVLWPSSTKTPPPATIPTFPGQTQGVVVPTQGSPTDDPNLPETTTVASGAGGSIVVRDFKKDPATLVASHIPGHHFISGGVDSEDVPYATVYVESDRSFNITLLQEPLKQNRLLAEKELMQKLGISEAQMCQLVYSVLVPYSVNQIYAGKNLGFSFCPGAATL